MFVTVLLKSRLSLQYFQRPDERYSTSKKPNLQESQKNKPNFAQEKYIYFSEFIFFSFLFLFSNLYFSTLVF